MIATSSRIVAALLLSSTLTGGTDAQTTSADDSFEAALRATPARSAAIVAAPSGRRARGIKPIDARPAAAEMVPAEWRGPLASRGDLNRAERAAAAGQLDPLAFIVQQGGPIPMPMGSRALRCTTQLRATITLGADESPAVRQHAEAARREQADLRATGQGRSHAELSLASPMLHQAVADYMSARHRPDVKRRLAEVARFLQASGFVPFRLPAGLIRWRRSDAQVGWPTLDLELEASAFTEAQRCADVGIAMPVGPWFSAQLAFPDPDWSGAIVRTPEAG